MKALTEKIFEECNTSRTLRESAWIERDFVKSQEIRKQQREHWEKFNFMKKLGKAIERCES